MSEQLNLTNYGVDLSSYLTDEAQALIRERLRIAVKCQTDLKYRAAILKLCREGTPDGMPGYLFFARYFASILEPRNPPGFQRLPFVPYEYQIEELKVIHESVQKGLGVLGSKQIQLWLKSRDMGLTWLVLLYFVWDWLFNGGSFVVGSFKGDEVDYKGSAKTLFGKMRFLVYNLPKWMLPKDLEDKTMLLSYNNGESAITGDTCNPNFGRGDRKKAALLDEYAQWECDQEALHSVSQTTNVLFLVGTPKGYGNHYAQIVKRKSIKAAGIRKVHWTKHPLKSRGFKLVNGMPWSPWYQDQVDNLDREIIASELDLSFELSLKGVVFDGMYGHGHQRQNLIDSAVRGERVLRIWDPGVDTFGVMFLQRDRKNRVRVLREHLFHREKLADIAHSVIQTSSEIGGVLDCEFADTGDPAGSHIGNAAQDDPEYTILQRDHGIYVDYRMFAEMQTKQRVKSRIKIIERQLGVHIPGRDANDDGPGLLIDVDLCPNLDEAFLGGYKYKTDKAGNILPGIEERHPYEDVMDCLGYGLLYEIGLPYEQTSGVVQQYTEDQLEDMLAAGALYDPSYVRTRRC